MNVSGSADSSLKLWSVEIRKLVNDLPGHEDEVYTVDWSPESQKIISSG